MTKPITTQAALNAPCLSATEHVLRTLTKRPPTGLTSTQRKALVLIIEAGKELIKDQRDTIQRIEAAGAVWRLAVKPPIRSALGIKSGNTPKGGAS